MYSLICARWLELCVQTRGTVHYSLQLHPDANYPAKLGLGFLYRLHGQVESP